jgi:hypothetical protein
MVIASQLSPGIALKIADDIFKVVESTFHVGQGDAGHLSRCTLIGSGALSVQNIIQD